MFHSAQLFPPYVTVSYFIFFYFRPPLDVRGFTDRRWRHLRCNRHVGEKGGERERGWKREREREKVHMRLGWKRLISILRHIKHMRNVSYVPHEDFFILSKQVFKTLSWLAPENRELGSHWQRDTTAVSCCNAQQTSSLHSLLSTGMIHSLLLHPPPLSVVWFLTFPCSKLVRRLDGICHFKRQGRVHGGLLRAIRSFGSISSRPAPTTYRSFS